MASFREIAQQYTRSIVN